MKDIYRVVEKDKLEWWRPDGIARTFWESLEDLREALGTTDLPGATLVTYELRELGPYTPKGGASKAKDETCIFAVKDTASGEWCKAWTSRLWWKACNAQKFARQFQQITGRDEFQVWTFAARISKREPLDSI